MKTLILTVGLPRSGKSTWAKKQNLPIVNPDSVRLALHGKAFIQDSEPMVWVITEYMVKSLFLAGHDKVILDATNTTFSRRSKWESKKWVLEYKEFKTDEDTCLKRAVESNPDLIPVIKKMNDFLTFPSDE